MISAYIGSREMGKNNPNEVRVCRDRPGGDCGRFTSFLMLLVAAIELQVVATFADLATTREGISAEQIRRPTTISAEAFANDLVKAKGLTSWGPDDPTSSKDGEPLGDEHDTPRMVGRSSSIFLRTSRRYAGYAGSRKARLRLTGVRSDGAPTIRHSASRNARATHSQELMAALSRASHATCASRRSISTERTAAFRCRVVGLTRLSLGALAP